MSEAVRDDDFSWHSGDPWALWVPEAKWSGVLQVMVDHIYYDLAKELCASLYKRGGQSNSEHGPERWGGQPCEECCDVAYDVLHGRLGRALAEFARTSYFAGRRGMPEIGAVENAIRAVGQPIRDRLAVDDLIRSVVDRSK